MADDSSDGTASSKARLWSRDRRGQESLFTSSDTLVDGSLDDRFSMAIVTWVEREYVYHPSGDVDAMIVQINEGGYPYYVLQDGNPNVVALLNGEGAISQQYSYSTYGELLATELFGLSDSTCGLRHVGQSNHRVSHGWIREGLGNKR